MSLRFGHSTLVPADSFNPVIDAQSLRNAMKGFGTDEKALISTLCYRSNQQRQIIKSTYKTNFGKDLEEDIRSETSGNFRKILTALLIPTFDYYAKEIHEAISGAGTDEEALIEIICPSSNHEIRTIIQAYKRIYGKDLEKELVSDTSGCFKRLLVSLINANRDSTGNLNHDAATRDARHLKQSGVDILGTDESTFNMIFCQRNLGQLRLICEKYHQLAGHSLEEAIENEFSGDIKNGLLAILKCCTNKNKYFATCLHKSMVGLGTNDDQLIRLIVTRCEIDLYDIKVAFQRLYGKDLRSWIKDDTSGDYKHALYALIGEEHS